MEDSGQRYRNNSTRLSDWYNYARLICMPTPKVWRQVNTSVGKYSATDVRLNMTRANPASSTPCPALCAGGAPAQRAGYGKAKDEDFMQPDEAVNGWPAAQRINGWALGE